MPFLSVLLLIVAVDLLFAAKAVHDWRAGRCQR